MNDGVHVLQRPCHSRQSRMSAFTNSASSGIKATCHCGGSGVRLSNADLIALAGRSEGCEPVRPAPPVARLAARPIRHRTSGVARASYALGKPAGSRSVRYVQASTPPSRRSPKPHRRCPARRALLEVPLQCSPSGSSRAPKQTTRFSVASENAYKGGGLHLDRQDARRAVAFDLPVAVSREGVGRPGRAAGDGWMFFDSPRASRNSG